MISFNQKGSFKNTEAMLKKIKSRDYRRVLEKYAQQGVAALSAATPKDTGYTASSWSYEIVNDTKGLAIYWHNDHIEKGYANIALLLQYGHGTRNGGYVRGRDYINPAIRPIFDKMSLEAWKEVTGNG